MTIRPRDLPKARRQLLRYLDNPASLMRSGADTGTQQALDVMASHVRAAELFWVSEDMAALAVSSGAQLAAARWTTADRPAPCGLLWWGGGVGTVEMQGALFPVDGAAWGPGPDGACTVTWYCDRSRVVDSAAERGMEVVVEDMPPLVPMWAAHFPVTDEPVSLADLPEGAPLTPSSALAAAWLLMQQPKLVDRQRERADGAMRRAYARDGLPVPDVTLVDLRRQYVPQDADPDGESSGRRYRYRWVVSGHWRDQAYGPDRSLRRQTWIESYVKGPDGAPLLSTERVNVWRR